MSIIIIIITQVQNCIEWHWLKKFVCFFSNAELKYFQVKIWNKCNKYLVKRAMPVVRSLSWKSVKVSKIGKSTTFLDCRWYEFVSVVLISIFLGHRWTDYSRWMLPNLEGQGKPAFRRRRLGVWCWSASLQSCHPCRWTNVSRWSQWRRGLSSWDHHEMHGGCHRSRIHFHCFSCHQHRDFPVPSQEGNTGHHRSRKNILWLSQKIHYQECVLVSPECRHCADVFWSYWQSFPFSSQLIHCSQKACFFNQKWWDSFLCKHAYKLFRITAGTVVFRTTTGTVALKTTMPEMFKKMSVFLMADPRPFKTSSVVFVWQADDTQFS